MSRNNEDRLGVKHPDTPSPLATDSSGFSFTAPTEFVELPSKGKFYPENHPLHNKDVIEIKFMTAKEEDILTSVSLLKKGLAIERFIQSIIVDKSIDVNSLLVGDKNAITVAGRITGYCEEYETKIPCPACQSTVEYGFNLEDKVVNEGGIDAAPDLGIELEGNEFVIPLPKTKLHVGVKFLDGNDEKALAQLAEKKKKHKLPETNLTDQLKAIITSVSGERDGAAIAQFVENMPALDSRFLRGIYAKITPNIDLTQEFSCSKCGHTDDLEVPFTADFFWSK